MKDLSNVNALYLEDFVEYLDEEDWVEEDNQYIEENYRNQLQEWYDSHEWN